MAQTLEAKVVISARDQTGAAFASAQRQARALGDSMQAAGRRMRSIGIGLSAAITAPMVALAKRSLDDFQAQENALAATEAALASMGGQAGFTSKQLQTMASQLQENSIFGDEAILQSVTANLLTFGNVAGEQFERAQQAAIDLSARLGTDLQSSAVMVGKALNDPVRGLTALTRVGVAFDQQQRDQIKTMAQAGDVAQAQGLMLAELERQYGGQAAAQARTIDGQRKQLANAIGDLREEVGAVVADALLPMIKRVRELVRWFQELPASTKAWIVQAGAVAAAMGPLLIVGGQATILLGGLAKILTTTAVPAMALLGKAAGARRGGLTSILRGLRTASFMTAASLGFTGLSGALGGTVQATRRAAAGSRAATTGLSQMATAAAGGAGGGAAGAMSTVAKAVGAGGLGGALLKWAPRMTLWAGLAAVVYNQWNRIRPAFEGAAEGIVAALQNRLGPAIEAVRPLLEPFRGAWEAVAGGVRDAAGGIAEAAMALWEFRRAHVSEDEANTIRGRFKAMFGGPTLEQAKMTLKLLPELIKKAFGIDLTDEGRQTLQSFWNGIKSLADRFLAFLGGIADQVRGVFGGAAQAAPQMPSAPAPQTTGPRPTAPSIRLSPPPMPKPSGPSIRLSPPRPSAMPVPRPSLGRAEPVRVEHGRGEIQVTLKPLGGLQVAGVRASHPQHLALRTGVDTTGSAFNSDLMAARTGWV